MRIGDRVEWRGSEWKIVRIFRPRWVDGWLATVENGAERMTVRTEELGPVPMRAGDRVVVLDHCYPRRQGTVVEVYGDAKMALVLVDGERREVMHPAEDLLVIV